MKDHGTNNDAGMPTRQLVRDEITLKLRRIIEEQRGNRPVKIAAERVLAESLDVSRLSLRAAIKGLVHEGLLIQKQGSGTFIVPKTRIDAIHLFVAPDIKPKDPFYQEFFATFSHFLATQSIRLEVVTTDQTELNGAETPLILVGLAPQAIVIDLKKRYHHIVSVQSYPDSLDITQVFFDDYRIGQHAGQILQAHKHERLVHLCGPNAYPSAAERRRGFIDSLKHEGVAAEVIEGKMNWSTGYEMGDEVFSLIRGSYGATAVFAANDWMALGLLRRLTEKGVAIPDELSVIGCDDIHLATEIEPHLSTFRWDMDFLVSELFQVLNSLVYSDTHPHKRVLLPAEFIKRDSLVAHTEATDE
ncbi:MAG: GntR family transcriptional regulator [Spirochaetaceae bacterium]|nr:MAG: GntR family transcriptional regulator [Spirochaetaceae bacterium]